MAMLPWYVTRERVKAVLDIAETARRNSQVDDAIESASRNAEGLLNRTFYPRVGVEYFDWPPSSRGAGRAWKLYLDEREIAATAAADGVSVTVNNGATALTAGQFFLRPNQGSPFTRLEVNLGSAGVFSSGSTHQRAIAITVAHPAAWMGQPLDDRPAGALAEALDASETGVDVTDSSAIGTGTILLCGSERMIVTRRSLLTTGQTLQAPLSSDEASQTLSVTTGTAFAVDELLTVDSERMRVDDIAGNTLIVTRALDGSALAAHTSGTTIYAPRTLTVERGALGSTAAAHDTATALYRHVPLGPVAAVTTAYALNQLLQQSSGYARVAGSGDNQKEFTGRGIRALEDDAVAACGRSLRRYGGR